MKSGEEWELKTEWKEVVKSSAFPASEAALELSRNTVEGDGAFLA